MSLEEDIGFRREAYQSVRLPPRTVPLGSDVKVFLMTEVGHKDYANGMKMSEMLEGIHYFHADTIPFRHTPIEMQMQFEGRDVDGKYNNRIDARNTYLRRNKPNHKRDEITDRVRTIMLKADGYSNREIAMNLESSEKYVRNILYGK